MPQAQRRPAKRNRAEPTWPHGPQPETRRAVSTGSSVTSTARSDPLFSARHGPTSGARPACSPSPAPSGSRWTKAAGSGRQTLATASAATSQNQTTADSGGAGAEAMAALAHQLGGLIRPFHVVKPPKAALSIRAMGWADRPRQPDVRYGEVEGAANRQTLTVSRTRSRPENRRPGGGAYTGARGRSQRYPMAAIPGKTAGRGNGASPASLIRQG